MKRIMWDRTKAKRLEANYDRKITFERCAIAIENNDVLDDRENPARDGQRILILDIDNYAYVVPYVEDQDGIYLKTVFPSRKYTKEFFGR